MGRILSLAALLASTLVLAEDPPWRRQPDLDRPGVLCSPNPTDRRIASRAELDRLLGAWGKDCPGKAAFTQAVEKAKIDFSREALFLLAGFYGTGMAKASLALVAEGRVVTAAVTWRVPPPPVTPDTATYRFAFTVDKARIEQVRITVDGREKAVMSTDPETP